MSELGEASATSPPPVVGAGRRRAELRRRRRRQRRRAVAAALAVAVLATLLVTLFFVRRDSPPPADAPVAGRSQQTLLLQLRAADRSGVSNAVLAHESTAGAGSVLLVPPQVLATAPGGSPAPFSQVLRTASPASSRKALEDLLGITLDGSWVLDLPTLARLVDGLGGVSVDVDVPVLGGSGGRSVLLQPGEQLVDGARASSYVTYRAAGEQEQLRLARLQELVDGVLQVLPPSTQQVAGLLETLGNGSVVDGTDVADLADLLSGLAADQRADRAAYDTVPVRAVETGARTPSSRLDAERSRQVVDRLLPASVAPGARQGGNQVRVFNGVGTAALGDAARDQLVGAGLVYVSGGNAAELGVARTEVQIGEATPEHVALGQRVAAALGVPADAVRTSAPTSVADVVVVIGADFSPR